jgi:hypothetical protein
LEKVIRAMIEMPAVSEFVSIRLAPKPHATPFTSWTIAVWKRSNQLRAITEKGNTHEHDRSAQKLGFTQDPYPPAVEALHYSSDDAIHDWRVEAMQKYPVQHRQISPADREPVECGVCAQDGLKDL